MARPRPSPFDYAARNQERFQQRTRTLLLHDAFFELLGDVKPVLAYRIGDGFFYQVSGRQSLLPEEVTELKEIMLRKAGEIRPLVPEKLTKREAVGWLDELGRKRTRAWVEDSRGFLPSFYRSADGLLAFKGPLSKHTGDVGVWDLIPYPPGILMRVAPPGSDELPPYHESPTLFRTFFEAERWGRIHGASYVSDVNRMIRSGEIDSLVRVSEALQARRIAEIADRVALTQPRPRVVLISGPSGSGKTSFSRLLCIQFRLLGIRPVTLSLDNYYLPREEIPLGADGRPDYEILEALDTARFNEDLLRFVAGEEVHPPVLDFKTHRRRPGKLLRLDRDGILVVEGIHGLNPRLTRHLTAPSVYKIFVSALSHLNLDELSRISTTDVRLLRRIVRDMHTRGYDAAETLSRWPSVRTGEHLHIFPYQEEANLMFNSALPFELNALKPLAVQALEAVRNPELKGEAKRLRSLLAAVLPLPAEWTERHVCPTSIFREFVGGSLLIH